MLWGTREAERHAGTGGRPPRRRSRAYTLAEVSITLAILGVVAAIAVPRFSGAVARYRLDAAARRVAADLNMAREAARTTSQSRTVSFAPASGTYQIAGVRNMRDGSSLYTVTLGDDPYRVKLDSVNLGGDANIVYSGYGNPDSAGTVVVRIGQSTKVVEVDGSSGKAYVK